jgi:secreted PhoX family phosphatase
MGVWRHEAAAVDPVNETVYLTEDASDGRFYRYTPTAYPDLSAGTLEVCVVATDGSVTWGLVADPSGESAPTSTQVPEATIFPGNEGCWYHDGWVYFTSKVDHSVHGIDIAAQKYTLIWKGDPDGLGIEGAVLSHVDNITVDAGSGDLIVAEDGGNMELVIITPDGAVAPFVRVVAAGHELSEMTGPVFSPNRDRLYFSSQRGPSTRDLVDVIPGFAAIDAIGAVGAHAGVTFEITGPFRGVVVPEVVTTEAPTTIPSPVTTLTQAAPDTAEQSSDDNGGGSGVAIGVGVVAAAAVVGGAVAFRQRRMRDKAAE